MRDVAWRRSHGHRSRSSTRVSDWSADRELAQPTGTLREQLVSYRSRSARPRSRNNTLRENLGGVHMPGEGATPGHRPRDRSLLMSSPVSPRRASLVPCSTRVREKGSDPVTDLLLACWGACDAALLPGLVFLRRDTDPGRLLTGGVDDVITTDYQVDTELGTGCASESGGCAAARCQCVIMVEGRTVDPDTCVGLHRGLGGRAGLIPHPLVVARDSQRGGDRASRAS